MKKFTSISNVAKELDLINNKTQKPNNYILRYWEKEFKQIKPKIINNRRYYSPKLIELIKFIKFLLKEKKLTINGVKSILNTGINKLDDYKSNSLKADYYRKKIKEKSKNILKKINKIKNYGKKNSH